VLSLKERRGGKGKRWIRRAKRHLTLSPGLFVAFSKEGRKRDAFPIRLLKERRRRPLTMTEREKKKNRATVLSGYFFRHRQERKGANTLAGRNPALRKAVIQDSSFPRVSERREGFLDGPNPATKGRRRRNRRGSEAAASDFFFHGGGLGEKRNSGANTFEEIESKQSICPEKKRKGTTRKTRRGLGKMR